MEVDTSIRERTTLHFLDEHDPSLVVPMLLLPTPTLTPTLTLTREVEVAVDKCCNLQYLMAGMTQRWGMNRKLPQGEVDGEVRSKKVNSALLQVHEVVAPCPRCKALSMAVEISVGRRGGGGRSPSTLCHRSLGFLYQLCSAERYSWSADAEVVKRCRSEPSLIEQTECGAS